MPIIIEEVEPITNHTVVTNNQPITIFSQPTQKQTNLTVNNGQAINSKRNSAKQFSKTSLQKLIDEQTIRYKQLLQMQKTNTNIETTIPPKVPATSSLISYHLKGTKQPSQTSPKTNTTSSMKLIIQSNIAPSPNYNKMHQQQ